jgi:L-rhamnose isomerase
MVLRVVTNKTSKILSYVLTTYGATGEVLWGSEIVFEFDDECEEVAEDIRRLFGAKAECL